MIQRVAILDSETTGKSPEEGRCIEVACCIYDVPRATPVRSFASLLQGPAENAAEPVNGIPPAILPDAPEAARVWKVLSYAVEGCSALVAHKADFDMQFIPQDVQHGLPWICTFNDLAWPKAFKRGMGLVAIAHAHGLGVSHVHRAAADVDIISRLFSRVAEMGVDLQAFLEHGLRPKTRLVALADKDKNEELKSWGFQWSKDEQLWSRNMPAEDAATLPFRAVPYDSLVLVRVKATGYDKERNEQAKAAGFHFEEVGSQKLWLGRVPREDIAGLPFEVVEVQA